MADKKITDLTNKATAASADIVPIVDPTDNTTKRTTVAGLATAMATSLPAAGVKAASIDFATFIQAERRLPAAHTASGYSVAPLGAAISGSTYGSGIFTVATDGSITIIKKCLLTIDWCAYINSTGSAGFMWLINKNSTSIDLNRVAGTGYSGTTDFRYNSVSISILAAPSDVFRVGYYKSIAIDTDITLNGCSVSALALT